MCNELYVRDHSRGSVSRSFFRKWAYVSLRLSPFCLAVMLGVTAFDQSKADDGLASQDRARSDTSAQGAPLDGIDTHQAAGKQLQALERERSKAEASRRELAEARTELLLKLCKDGDALKTNGEREENLRRELAAARLELSTMRGIGEKTCTQPGADPNKQAAALERQRQIAEGLASDLALAQRAFERVKTDAIVARNAAEASLAEMRQALEEERRKAALLERDLDAAHRSLEALETRARLAATTQVGAMQGRQLAEAAAKQTGEALARERERADALASDLETARRERDAAKEELTRTSSAWEVEHKKTVDLARDLAAATKEIDVLKREAVSNASRIENAAKTRPAKLVTAQPVHRKSAPRSVQLEIGGADNARSVRPTTIMLPAALRPRRPPAEGFRQ